MSDDQNPQSPRRVLLKLSGEAFSGPAGFGIEASRLAFIAGEIRRAHELGVQIAVVVGGGNMESGKFDEVDVVRVTK